MWWIDHGRLLRWECGDTGIVSNNGFVLDEQIKAFRVSWTCPTCPAATWARGDHECHLKNLFLRSVLHPQLVGWCLLSPPCLAALLALDTNTEKSTWTRGQLQKVTVRSVLLSEASLFWLRQWALGSSVTSPRSWGWRALALGFAPGTLLCH